MSAAAAIAQDVRGTVRDGANQVPIPGAVVISLGPDGRQFARTVTDEQGRFTLPRAAGAIAVRALRIGFRPHDAPIPEAPGAATVDITMAVLPQLLERVVAIANPQCKKSSDADMVFGLWQQAQAGLLATVVSRESNPARSQVVVAQRERSRQRDTISEQRVRLQTGMYTNSFFAAQPPADYIKWGFVVQDRTGHNTFYLPDAEVMLSEPFASAYCIAFANRDRSRPTQVGLRFTVAEPVPPRVDIDGTLWIDTAARVIREIEFKYMGLEPGADRYRPGGYVRFHAMPNGLVLVNEWLTRMVSREIDTMSTVRNARRLRDLRESATRGGGTGDFGETRRPQDRPFAVSEQVGELVRAEWADGARYRASLGAVRIHTTNMNGTPMAGARVRLDSTDYFGVSDSTGTIVLQDLVPGPYHVVVADSLLETIGLQVETPAWFTASRDTTLERTVAVGSAAEALAQVCGDIRYGGAYHLFAARAVNTRGQTLAGVKWSITPILAAGATGAMPVSTGATNGDGLMLPCIRFEPGREIELRAWREVGEYREATPKVVRLTLTSRATALRLDLGR